MNQVEAEAIRLGAMLLSLEKWADRYNKSPEQHAQLLKQGIKYKLALIRLFKDMANHAGDYINKQMYDYQLAQSKLSKEQLDYNIDVIVNDDLIDNSDQTFIQISYSPIKDMIITGAESGPVVYGKPLISSQTDPKYQKMALNKVASLVGKKVVRNPDGSIKEIIDNPNPKFNVIQTVRDDIAASIENSLAMGLTSDEATAEIADIIGMDDYRAERIANTESVNAFNQGVMSYGDETNAVGKEWESMNTLDMCGENMDAGPIPIGDDFPSGVAEPTAHVGCMCAVRLIYEDEWNREGYGSL